MSRLTGFSPLVRKQIQDRAGTSNGFTHCEGCGRSTDAIQLHHRRPRGAGGSRRPDTNLASNGLALCGFCHSLTESRRSEALELGQLVPQHRAPAEVPVLRRNVWVLLGNDGDIQEIPEPATGSVA